MFTHINSDALKNKMLFGDIFMRKFLQDIATIDVNSFIPTSG